MKSWILYLQLIFFIPIYSQNLQLHYDFRHSLDPKFNEKNFPTIYFDYFNSKEFGSFLLKIQSDLSGTKNNIGKFYIQASQSIRFFKSNISFQIQYSGGLGIAEPGESGYYINNAFSAGGSYSFQWDSAWFNVSISYTLNGFKIPSHDVLTSFYWGKGFFNYKLEFNGDLDIYTQNKNIGDEISKDQHGKKFSFFAEPQLWYNLNDYFSVGSKINLYYHVLTDKDIFQVYPTAAIKYKL